MKSFYFVLYSVALWALAGCDSGPKPLPVINADHPSGSIELALSDILEDIRIVPLETTDASLVTSGGSSIMFVTDRYIIASGTDKVLLFDKDGRYLKSILNKGNGPNEYQYLNGLLMDEVHDILYYRDPMKRESIYRLSLPEIKYLDPFVPTVERFNPLRIDAQGRMYGFPVSAVLRIGGENPEKPDSTSSVLLLRQDPSDNSLQSFSGHRPYQIQSTGLSMALYRENLHFFNFSYSDTLFRLSQDKLQPLGVFSLQNRMKRLEAVSAEGDDLRLLYAYRNGIVMQTVHTGLDISHDSAGEISSISVRNHTVGVYHFDHQGHFQTLKKLYIDPLALEVDVETFFSNQREGRSNPISPMLQTSGNWGYIVVDALNIMDLMQNALDQNKLSSAQRKSLEGVLAQLEEDSNSVLILGRIK